MKPSEIRPGDRIIYRDFGCRIKGIVRAVEEIDPEPGMAEYSYRIRFLDGSSGLMRRTGDYKSWIPDNK